MQFHILTLFPEMVENGLQTSILGRAIQKGLIGIHAVNIRDYTQDKHNKVDDYPYGGGAGMLMQAQPVYDAWKAVAKPAEGKKPVRVLFMSPQGKTFSQEMAKELAQEEELIFLCGHYEGIDERVIEEIAPYWKGKTYHEALAAALPPEIHKLTYDDPKGLISRFIVNETSSFRSSIQWVHDYGKILKRGFNDIKREAQEKLAALDPASAKDMCEKKPFLDAVVIVCDAIVLWAKRHADEARKVAEKTDDPVRKAELLRMAANAERVPGEPARDFWEACQSQWFVQMFSRIEQKTGTTISNGRMDQYFYPFYKKDMEAGILTDEKTLEYLECMWVGMAEFIDMYISPCGGAFNEGYAHWEAVTVGGQTPDGRDATNELTHLILKSKREFPLHYPDLAARIHSRSPESYLWDVAETIKDGSGFPKLINDEEVVPLYVAKGATFEEALDYAVSGCTEARMPNRDTFTSGGAYINFAAAVEMVLRNGRMKKYGDIVLGEETGDPRNFKTWDEFWNAYVKQHMLFLRTAFTQQYIVNNLRAQHFAQPMGSAMHDLCMKHCIDLHQTHIPEGVDFGYFEYMGLGTVVDSLSAIKYAKVKCIRNEQGLVTDYEIEGDFLKYGNDDDRADDIAVELLRSFLEKIKRRHTYRNSEATTSILTITSNVVYGKATGAMPDGRKAYTPFAPGGNPSYGAETHGLLASLNSVAKLPYHWALDGISNTQTINPEALGHSEGERVENLVQVLDGYFDQGAHHLNVNVFGKEKLLDAMEHPEKEEYANFTIRVSGYAVKFIDLTREQQMDVISRTCHAAL